MRDADGNRLYHNVTVRLIPRVAGKNLEPHREVITAAPHHGFSAIHIENIVRQTYTYLLTHPVYRTFHWRMVKIAPNALNFIGELKPDFTGAPIGIDAPTLQANL